MQGGARFFENQLFEENEASRGDLGRTWTNLGAQGGQNGTKMGPKMAPKATPKTIKKKHRFWEATRGAMTRGGGGDFRDSGAPLLARSAIQTEGLEDCRLYRAQKARKLEDCRLYRPVV